LGTDNVAPTTDPEVIIPKINVEIPVNYSETSTDEATIENDLKDGIVHYPTTSLPGQNGNTAFFGHSSNNIFNKGKYKFAFVLLHELVPGDVFYLTNNGKVYAYKVFSKTVVEPSEVGVLDPVEGHTATATLITCDPPGTSLHRLVVVGDQISPDPTGNGQSTALAGGSSSAISQIVGNGPTLWTRWWGTGYGKTVTFLTLGILAVAFFRKMAPRSSATGLQA
jgi:LPXTG-site transpeptidase (sortase) family protein